MTEKDEEYYINELKRLREIIGSYRRRVQEKPCRRECIREGYDEDRNLHYKVYVVTEIPQDLEMSEVVKDIKNWFMPNIKGYRFQRCDFSAKYKGWLVQVCRNVYL